MAEYSYHDVLEKRGKYWILRMEGNSPRRFKSKREACKAYRFNRFGNQTEAEYRRQSEARGYRYIPPRLEVKKDRLPKGYRVERGGYVEKRAPRSMHTQRLVEAGKPTRFKREV
jgi:hypothetical protein